jgi:DNA polymerase-3 subunit epsilon
MIDYLRGAELIIHNAAFDVGFLDHELRLWRADAPRIEELCTVIDTLAMARRMHPGQRNSLDALCRRYEVDNTRRELHGALLDAEILADVYLAMTGGQAALGLGAEAQAGGEGAGASGSDGTAVRRRIATERPRLAVIHASEAELELHAGRLAAIDEASGGACVWRAVSPAR